MSQMEAKGKAEGRDVTAVWQIVQGPSRIGKVNAQDEEEPREQHSVSKALDWNYIGECLRQRFGVLGE
jgi:hypothetical protein